MSTLIVCNSRAKSEIENLISTNPPLLSAGCVSQEQAIKEIGRAEPQVVWLDITDSVDHGLVLLKKIKEGFPHIHCLVSSETLDPQALRSSMQAGAFDFLDSKTWTAQVTDVVERLVAHDAAQAAAHAAEKVKKEQMLQELDAKRRQTASSVELDAVKLRAKTSEVDLPSRIGLPSRSGPRSKSPWNITFIAFILAALLVALLFLHQ
ncbi:MAG: hypothetical protein K2Z81_08815 [Cyanobacteria bacterium]|nr:hypothetical protein [Cyanobacteriota bacterium]